MGQFSMCIFIVTLLISFPAPLSDWTTPMHRILRFVQSKPGLEEHDLKKELNLEYKDP